MFCKVPYTSIAGRHRPYLEVSFLNTDVSKSSNKTFAIVDSGADHTIIPYSIGELIGLSAPTEQEKLASVTGVGGNLSYIERKCRIYILNRKENIYYGFDETVWWIYPDAGMQEERKKLVKSYFDLKNLHDQCIPGTELQKHFQNQMDQTIAGLNQISNRLETGVLLGRPFFNNFDYIQFFHKDREKEEKCFFNYKITKGKPIDTFPVLLAEQSPPKGLKVQQNKTTLKKVTQKNI